MTTSDQRRDTVQELRQRVPVPHDIYLHLEKDIPSRSIRGWIWWAAIWPRPTAETWEFNEAELEVAQESWDASRQHVDNQNALMAELEARRSEEAEQLRVESEKLDAKRLETLTAELRRAYLSQPGTTEESFEKALPELLEQRARDATLSGKSGRPVLPGHLYN